ncbi:MAG: hypothetical protein AAFQ58_13635 [Pseudomonadota bacterium]
MALHPTFLGSRDPAAAIVTDIALLGGGTDTPKDALYADIRRHLEMSEFAPETTIVILIEKAAIGWSFDPQGSVKKVLGR